MQQEIIIQYTPWEKAKFHAKLQVHVTMVFALTSSWVWPALECIARNGDISFTRGRRVKKIIILHYTSSRKTSFHANLQAQRLHGLT